MVSLGLWLLLKKHPAHDESSQRNPSESRSTLWYCAFHPVISVTWPVLICVIKLEHQTILANCCRFLGGL